MPGAGLGALREGDRNTSVRREKHLAPVLVKLSRKTPYLPAGHQCMSRQTHSSAAPEPLEPALSGAPGASPFTHHRLMATVLSPGRGHPLSLPQAVQEGSVQHPLGLGHRGVLALHLAAAWGPQPAPRWPHNSQGPPATPQGTRKHFFPSPACAKHPPGQAVRLPGEDGEPSA